MPNPIAARLLAPRAGLFPGTHRPGRHPRRPLARKSPRRLQEIFREQHNREATPIHLLSDIRDAFAHHQNPERLFTAELLAYLHNLDDRPWYEWSKNGDPITAQDLSRILGKSFDISPRALR